jgi:alpha-beta hydrolase superfamily lysophospholipase
MRSAHVGVPLFAWGHSLGALVVLEAVLRAPLGLTGAVASAPPLVPTVTGRWLPALARLVSPLWPGWSVRLGLDAAGLSREPGVVEANRADPLNHRRISARLGTEARTAIRWTMNNADMLRTPLLIVHGGADRLSSPAGSRAFMARATFPDRQLLEYEGGYHELHNDTIRNTVLGDVERWLRRHV